MLVGNLLIHKKMKIKTLLLFAGGSIIAIVLACVPPKVSPLEPEISFKEMSMYNGQDTLGNDVKRVVLTMSVVDGDGNIGLPEDEVLPGFDTLDNKNLFIELYNKVDGEFEKVELASSLYYRTKFIEFEGQDKTLTADFEVTMDNYKFDDYDTIKYDFFIYDRDLNKSNTGETPAVPADTTGVISLN